MPPSKRKPGPGRPRQDSGFPVEVDRKLLAAYTEIGCPLDRLPYTPQFEAIMQRLDLPMTDQFRRVVFQRLVYLRKHRSLPRLVRIEASEEDAAGRDDATEPTQGKTDPANGTERITPELTSPKARNPVDPESIRRPARRKPG